VPRRKGPPHFKAFVTVQNHRKMRGVYDNDAILAMWLRSGWLCLERFADRTGDTILVSRRDLARVAATSPWVNVQRKLRSLVAATPLRVRCGCAADPLRGRCECAAMSLEFPNFAKRHNFRGTSCTPEGDYSDADADADANHAEVREKTSASEGGDCSPNRKPHGKTGTSESKDESPPPKPRLPSILSPESEATFDLLLWAIEESMPGASIPDPGTTRYRHWCEELDRLHRLGEKGSTEGFSWEDIQAVIRWLPTHRKGDFEWGLVIRSARKLRDHFARLLAQMKAAERAPTRESWRGAAQAVHRDIMGDRRDDGRGPRGP
jgi:hypothetical protein